MMSYIKSPIWTAETKEVKNERNGGEMEGFVMIGKVKTVFATLKILAELEWQVLNLVGLLYGKVIKLEEVKNGNQTQ